MDIVILTDYKGYLRQQLNKSSMDKELITELFSNKGFRCTEYTYEEFVNKDVELEDKLIIYTSSQNKGYKEYIDDVLYHLSKSNTLIPRYDIFKAHENKGYQELLKKEVGIKSLEYRYFGNLEGVRKNKDLLLEYPFILKKVTGAGSTNVFKINDHSTLISKIREINTPRNYFTYSIKRVIKKYFFKSKYSNRYYAEDVMTGPILLQEFMEDLIEDWKILVFGKKYYVLNRKVRENDFRASGSGKLSFIDPPEEVLEYAKEIFLKLDTPFISLDIGYDGKRANLIEFQGTHFGPYTLVNSESHFVFENDKWIKIDKKSNLEEEYVESAVEYIKSNILGNIL